MMFAKLTGILIITGVVLGVIIITDSQQAKAEGRHATFDGKLACLACTLKDEEGARAECRNFGHIHALRTDDGKFISFLENKYSKDLFEGEKYLEKEISVSGVYYEGANQLDVESFTIDGITVTWCKNHKIMDDCNSNK